MHQLHRVFVRVPLAALAVLLIGAGSAARAENARLSAVRIDNFGTVNDHYYRGAQPAAADYPGLAALGVKTVIDLTRDGRDDEKGLVEAAGMKFVRIPLTTTEAPAEMAITQFLALVNDPANQPVYVHCQGGRHRTGTMTAIYRMTRDGWTPARAYEEMKQYRFEGFPGHPALKNFVLGYQPSNERLNLAKATTPQPLAAGTTAAATQ
jgi:protein tyrosine/serine phosphatase